MQTGILGNLDILFRWLHVIAGITWIGHLYFFNFVNIQLQASIDDATKKAVNPQLMPRALWWFRWGAMVTFILGLVLFTINYMYVPGVGFGPNANFSNEMGITARAIWIMLGAFFGTWMWFNVWFLIWPTQKIILGGKASPDQLPALRAKAGKYSRWNTFFSGPMLFGMLAPNHYGSASALTIILAISIGMIAISLAYRASKNVGKTV
jgi:uncharacterized membrane protein